MLISITRKLDDAKKERKGKLVTSAFFYALSRTAPLRDISKNDSVQRRLWCNLSRSLKETKEIFNNLRLVNLKTLKTVLFQYFESQTLHQEKLLKTGETSLSIVLCSLRIIWDLSSGKLFLCDLQYQLHRKCRCLRMASKSWNLV